MHSVPLPSAFVRTVESLGRAMTAVSLALMLLLALPIVYDAVMRAFGYPTIWVFETTLYAFIFIGFLGNALAVKRGAHFRVTILAQLFPRLRRTFDMISDLSVIAFALLIIASGVYFSWYSWTNTIGSSTLLEVPLWIPNLAIPIGGLGLLLQSIVSLCSDNPDPHQAVIPD